MALTPEDHVAINQLYVRYNHLFDFGEGTDWAGLFVDDGTLEATGTVTQGTPALVEFWTETQKNVPGIRHIATNVMVDGDGDTATGACYLQATMGAGNDRMTLITGRYDDTLTRTADGWKFASRSMTSD